MLAISVYQIWPVLPEAGGNFFPKTWYYCTNKDKKRPPQSSSWRVTIKSGLLLSRNTFLCLQRTTFLYFQYPPVLPFPHHPQSHILHIFRSPEMNSILTVMVDHICTNQVTGRRINPFSLVFTSRGSEPEDRFAATPEV